MQSTESSVSSIIVAFTSGLDVFKKLRERRRPRQCGHGKPFSKRGNCCKHSRHQGHTNGEKNGDELRLSKSLRRGSMDVQKVYEQHVSKRGARYAAGDATAHASLAHTLLKLNAGLVNIISSFLTCGKHNVPIDYQSLTSLSDTSRAEAIDALGKLYTRLSRSDLALQQRHTGGHNSGQRTGGKASAKPVNGKHGSKQETWTVDTSAALPLGLAKVTVHTSQTHLALIRPAARRKVSATSTGTGSSRGSRSNSNSNSPPQRSPPHTPQTPLTPPPSYPASPMGAPPGSFPFSVHQQSPPPQYHSYAFPPSSPLPQPQMQQVPQHAYQYLSDPQARRRNRDSYYSFMTDSTKLGEIPMRKWTVPYDFAEMERLNAQAKVEGWMPTATAGAAPEQGKVRWFGRLFRRGGG